MNRICPVCEADFLETAMKQPPVPIEENDRIGTLHFCTEECRERYLESKRLDAIEQYRPHSVACPVCDASDGSPCVETDSDGPTDTPRRFHQERIEVAEEINGGAEDDV